MRLPEHGANSARLYESMNMPVPAQVLDFSENCNPAGPPEAVMEAWPALLNKITSYPDPEGRPFLQAAAAYHGLDETRILAGNGAAELLSLLAGRYRGKRVAVVDPTFSEYRSTLAANGAEVVSIQAEEEDGFALPKEKIIAALPELSALYLCTPNNPTGILPSEEELLAIADAARMNGTEIILDEAFIDFISESRSFVRYLNDYPHVIIVRSMTKMYSIPGIRLGYLIAEPDVVTAVKRQAPHWNINGIAAEVGALCLQEEEYRERAITHAACEQEKMTDFLRANQCRVIDSKVNYLVFSPKRNPRELYRWLLGRGIAVRHTENYRGMDGRWLRIGMKSAEMMETLREAMDKWFKAQ